MVRLIGRISKRVYTYNTKYDKLGDGGYGDVYSVKEDLSLCVKVYKLQHNTSYEIKITFMCDNKPFNGSVKREISDILVWPIEPVEDQNGRFVGFTMRKITESVDLSAISTSKIHKPSLKKHTWLNIYKRTNKGAYRVRILLSHNIAQGLNLLHKTGKYVMVDCKPENIRLTPNGKVYLIDMDGIQVVDNNRVLHHAMASTEEIMPPEAFNNKIIPSKTKIEPDWDVFSFGVIAYLLIIARPPFTGTLLDRAIPSASVTDVNSMVFLVKNKYFPMGRYKHLFKQNSITDLHPIFNKLSGSIQKLFLKTFEQNNRPSMQEWVDVLRYVHDKLPKQKPMPLQKTKPNTNNSNPNITSTKINNKVLKTITIITKITITRTGQNENVHIKVNGNLSNNKFDAMIKVINKIKSNNKQNNVNINNKNITAIITTEDTPTTKGRTITTKIEIDGILNNNEYDEIIKSIEKLKN